MHLLLASNAQPKGEVSERIRDYSRILEPILPSVFRFRFITRLDLACQQGGAS